MFGFGRPFRQGNTEKGKTMDSTRSAEWRELTGAVSAAMASGNEFYARRIMQRVRAKELTIENAVHLLQTDKLRVSNLRRKIWV